MTQLLDAAPSVGVRLLGPPTLRLAQGEQAFAPERPFLLLAFLAIRRDWVRRDALADLLYPGRELDSARSNLRKVLFLARKLPGGDAIAQRGDLLRWAPASDLAAFEAACDARQWASAVALYGGPLLMGLDAAWPADALQWLEAERQRLQSRWQEACSRRLAELQDDPAALRDLAQVLLRHDPLDDEALQALARAQQALGQADQALAAVADFTRRLSSELQLEPSAAVRRMAGELRSATPVAPPAGPQALVGRRHELALVRDRLAQPGCRMLTLLGQPGVGKSALAQAAAAALGGRWLTLEPLADPDAVATAAATALQLTLDTTQEPWAALARALGTGTALLVLDNCEHLALAAPLSALLAACPGLRVLATARQPVGATGEWRLPLDGLPLPDPDETDPEVLRANDAVRLFELRALPLAPDFQLAAEAADVVRLVHEVDGLPLAIELLAAWRRLMPVREVLAELAASLDVLEPSTPGDRSVRAAFERSWQQLGPVAQRVLAQLAALPGPCDRELVRRVLQAPLPVLAALVDRSLLRADGDGRFVLHPLIRRLAEPWADDREALLERHAHHVAATLGRDGAAMARAMPHALAAWRWAVAQADVAVLGALAETFERQFRGHQRYLQGAALMGAAAAALQARLPAAPVAGAGAHEMARVLGLALAGQARLLVESSLLDEALATAEGLAALGRAWSVDSAAAHAATIAGSIHWRRGDYAAAHRAFSEHRRLALEAGDARGIRSSASWLALVAKAQGDYAQALALYEGSVREMRAAGELAKHLYVLNNTGNLLRLLGRHDEALALLQEALATSATLDDSDEEPYLQCNIALVRETQGRLEEAMLHAERAVVSARLHGTAGIEAAALLLRARLHARRTGQRSALADVQAALAIAEQLRSPPVRLQALSSGGVVLAAAGDVARGVAIVRWAMAQPDFARSEIEDAQRHLAALGLADTPGEALPPATPASAVQALLR